MPQGRLHADDSDSAAKKIVEEKKARLAPGFEFVVGERRAKNNVIKSTAAQC
jgi:hypothetical protein